MPYLVIRNHDDRLVPYEIRRLEDDLWELRNNHSGKVYKVSRDWCECPDHLYRRRPCKHMLSVRQEFPVPAKPVWIVCKTIAPLVGLPDGVIVYARVVNGMQVHVMTNDRVTTLDIQEAAKFIRSDRDENDNPVPAPRQESLDEQWDFCQPF
jgi:hypothetical protein